MLPGRQASIRRSELTADGLELVAFVWQIGTCDVGATSWSVAKAEAWVGDTHAEGYAIAPSDSCAENRAIDEAVERALVRAGVIPYVGESGRLLLRRRSCRHHFSLVRRGDTTPEAATLSIGVATGRNLDQAIARGAAEFVEKSVLSRMARSEDVASSFDLVSPATDAACEIHAWLSARLSRLRCVVLKGEMELRIAAAFAVHPCSEGFLIGSAAHPDRNVAIENALLELALSQAAITRDPFSAAADDELLSLCLTRSHPISEWSVYIQGYRDRILFTEPVRVESDDKSPSVITRVFVPCDIDLGEQRAVLPEQAGPIERLAATF